MAQGKTEETLSSLENMCYHAVEYDKSYIKNHGEHYTSILVDKLAYPEPSKDFHELKEHSQCWYMLDRIQSKRYDPIHNDKRFEEIQKTLKEYAI